MFTMARVRFSSPEISCRLDNRSIGRPNAVEQNATIKKTKAMKFVGVVVGGDFNFFCLEIEQNLKQEQDLVVHLLRGGIILWRSCKNSSVTVTKFRQIDYSLAVFVATCCVKVVRFRAQEMWIFSFETRQLNAAAKCSTLEINAILSSSFSLKNLSKFRHF